MLCEVADLAQRVRLAIDENTNEAALSFDATNLDLNQMIRAKLVEAVRLVHEQAPTRLVEGRPIVNRPVRNQDGSGYVVLPDDYMRLVIFRLDGWKRPVVRPIDDSSPDYALQKNKHVRGNADKPVCALSTDGSGNRILEYYSLPGSVAEPVVTQALYVPYPAVTADGKLEVSRRLTDAAVYLAAGLTMITLGESDRAKEFMDLSTLFTHGNIDK